MGEEISKGDTKRWDILLLLLLLLLLWAIIIDKVKFILNTTNKDSRIMSSFKAPKKFFLWAYVTNIFDAIEVANRLKGDSMYTDKKLAIPDSMWLQCYTLMLILGCSIHEKITFFCNFHVSNNSRRLQIDCNIPVNE